MLNIPSTEYVLYPYCTMQRSIAVLELDLHLVNRKQVAQLQQLINLRTTK